MHIRLNGTLCKARPTWGGNERSCCTQSPNLLVLCRNLLHFIIPALKLPAQGVLGTLQSFFKPLLDHAVGYLQQCLKSAQGRERGSVEVSLTGISLSFNKSSINIFISFIIYLLMSKSGITRLSRLENPSLYHDFLSSTPYGKSFFVQGT